MAVVAVNTPCRQHALGVAVLAGAANVVHDLVATSLGDGGSDAASDLVERLDEFLGCPTVDPHGDPIPDNHGNMTQIHKTLLAQQPINGRCVLKGVKDADDAFLAYLSQKNIKLGSIITVLEKEPFDESMTIEIDHNTHFISKIIATNIYVQAF